MKSYLHRPAQNQPQARTARNPKNAARSAAIAHGPSALPSNSRHTRMVRRSRLSTFALPSFGQNLEVQGKDRLKFALTRIYDNVLYPIMQTAAMNLITVRCTRPDAASDDEPRIAVTIASTLSEAEEVCRDTYGDEGYTGFYGADIVEGNFPGPARIIGYTGQRLAFAWKP
jgi:hypothetical protein